MRLRFGFGAGICGGRWFRRCLPLAARSFRGSLARAVWRAFYRDAAVLRWVRRLPAHIRLILSSHRQQGVQIHPVIVASILAQLVFVAHLDGVEVAYIHAYAAQNAPSEIYLEGIYYLASAALFLGELRVVRHLRAHTLRRTGADAHHTSGAVWLWHITIPQERGESHIAIRRLMPLIGVWILVGNRLAECRLERYYQPFYESDHLRRASRSLLCPAMHCGYILCRRKSLEYADLVVDFTPICDIYCLRRPLAGITRTVSRFMRVPGFSKTIQPAPPNSIRDMAVRVHSGQP